LIPRITKQIAYFCLMLVTASLLIEVIIQFFLPQDIVPVISEPAYGIPRAPLANLDIDMSNHRNYPLYHIITNSKRIRSQKEIPYSKPSETYRILCLGDSVFFGIGVNNNELFSNHLENLLNVSKNKTRYEVINASAVGWGLLEYATFLKNEGYKYSPDLVILSIYPDDIRQNFVDFISWERLESFEETIILKDPQIVFDSSWSIPKIIRNLRQLPFFKEITQNSHLFYFVRKRLSLKVHLTRKPLIKKKRLDSFLQSIKFQGYEKITWQFDQFLLNLPRFENNPIDFFSKFNKEDSLKAEANTVLYHYMVNHLVNIIQDMGAKPLVVHSPVQKETLKMTKTKPMPILKNKISAPLQLFLLKKFTRAQINFKTKIFFPHDNHWTPSGHRLVAWVLYNFIVHNIPDMNLSSIANIVNIFKPDMKEELNKANSRISEMLETDPFIIFLEGMRYKNLNQLDKAKRSLHDYLAIEAKDYDAYFQLGLIYLIEKKYTEAEDNFFKALENSHVLEKNKILSFYIYAKKIGKVWSFIQKGDFNKAVPYLEELTQLPGRFQEEANNMLALYYLKQGDMGRAIYYKNRNKADINFNDFLKNKMK
jgi:hypothetical protein